MKYCPKCKGVNICKDGVVNHKQRYLCKHCKYRFTRKQVLLGKNNKPNLVKQAVQLHLENMSLRGIGRLLGIHNKTVNNWLKEEANKINLNDFKVEESLVTELDEMHLYLGKKKTIVGSG
jgi:transposase-like protein